MAEPNIAQNQPYKKNDNQTCPKERRIFLIESNSLMMIRNPLVWVSPLKRSTWIR